MKEIVKNQSPKCWRMNRLGFFNFWYYDDEIYELTDGRLIFFGDNGSGKSVSMQSIIPVLLDGRLQPARLDPFGSRSRRMEDYLMGERDYVSYDERTGYIFLEFCNDIGEFFTVGMGLHFRWEGQLSVWYFTLEQDLRIGENFALFERSSSGDKIPLSFKKLRDLVPINKGLITRERKEYQERINKKIFGFSQIKAYDDLIRLLIELRSPKLSKDYKPSILYEILNNSLPDLPEESLRPLSESIEALANIGARLEKKSAEIKSAKQLSAIFTSYHAKSLSDKCNRLIRIQERLEQLKSEIYAIHEKSQQLEKAAAETEQNRIALTIRQRVLEEERQALSQHDAFRLAEELVQLKKQKDEVETRYQGSHNHVESRQRTLEQTKMELASHELERGRLRVELENQLDSLDHEAQVLGFQAHREERASLLRSQWHDFDFRLWQDAIAGYENILNHALQQVERIQVRLEAANKAAQSAESNREKFQQHSLAIAQQQSAYDEAMSHFLDNLDRWFELATECMSFSSDRRSELRVIAQGLFDFSDEYALYTPITQTYRESQRLLDQNNHRLAEQRREIEAAELAKTTQLQELRLAKDPEPPRSPSIQRKRAALQSQAIPHASFYEVLDFQDGITDTEKACIEAALLDSQLLDALIFPEDFIPDDRNAEIDKRIETLLSMDGHQSGLTAYLKADCSANCAITIHQVEALISALNLSNAYVLDNEGRYQIGPLKGHADDYGPARFIGKEARQRFRRQQISDLEGEVAALLEQKQLLTDLQLKNEQAIIKLDKCFDQLPQPTQAKNLHQSLLTLATQADFLKKLWDESIEEHRLAVEILNKERHQLDEFRTKTTVELNRAPLELAINVCKRYRTLLSSFEKTCWNLADRFERISKISSDIQDRERDLNYQRSLMQSLKNDLDQRQAQIISVENLLNIQGIDVIQERMRLVAQDLKAIPDQLLECARTEEKLLFLQEKTQTDEKACLAAQSELLQLQECFDHLLTADLNLGVLDINRDNESPKDILAQIRRLIPSDSQRTVERLRESARDAYHKYANELLDYGPKIREGDFVSFPINLEESNFAEDWGAASIQNQYMLAEFRILGNTVNLPAFLRQLEEDLVNDQAYYSETDRELYEEVLLNNVGQTLCEQIAKCQRWVEGMDRIMSSLQLTSGLSFSIKWVESLSEGSEQMKTRELLRLLADPKTLVKDDQSKLVEHFRSRIEGALARQRDAGEAVSYHEAIRNALDYRAWYRFQILIKKSAEGNFRNLSDRIFNTFSGGEKATAMYLPLWTAVSSHYDTAASFAPRIISLDEAFAGVDSTNIRNMFALIEEMNFGFLMNSQAVRGDYDTINGLTIAELYRPQGATLVTSTQYRWNGKVRTLLLSQSQAETSLGSLPMDDLFSHDAGFLP